MLYILFPFISHFLALLSHFFLAISFYLSFLTLSFCLSVSHSSVSLFSSPQEVDERTPDLADSVAAGHEAAMHMLPEGGDALAMDNRQDVGTAATLVDGRGGGDGEEEKTGRGNSPAPSAVAGGSVRRGGERDVCVSVSVSVSVSV